MVWFRFLLLFQDGTTLVFAVMLAAVLGGIGLGGMAASHLARRGWLSGGTARAAAAGAAAGIVAGYAALDGFLRLFAPIQTELVLMAVLASLFLMVPVAFLSGVLFTALGDQLRARMNDAGAATGALALANTLGGMLGSLLAAFVLLPALGIERSFFLLALLYAVIVVLIPAPGRAAWRWGPAAAAAIVLAAFPFGRMLDTYYRGVEERFFGGRLVAAREGIVQTTFYLRTTSGSPPIPTPWPPPRSPASAT